MLDTRQTAACSWHQRMRSGPSSEAHFLTIDSAFKATSRISENERSVMCLSIAFTVFIRVRKDVCMTGLLDDSAMIAVV